MPERRPPYCTLSSIYDRWQRSYGMEYNHSILPRLRQTFRRYGVTPSHLLEIGCGTGTMALLLSREGWNVVGIDPAEGMIAEARAKAGADSARIRFLPGDVRTLPLKREFQAAISLYDVFNHLASLDDVVAVLRAIHAALVPAGLLVFDVNNARGYRKLWRRDDTIREREFIMTIANSFDARAGCAISRVGVTFSDGRPGIEETITQKLFVKKELQAALMTTGFRVLESVDFAFPSAPGAGKLKTWWVAQTAGQPER